MLGLEAIELTLGAFRLRVDAQVPRGQRVAVLGASGSGKSMLLSLLAGFLVPEAGAHHVAGAGPDPHGPRRTPDVHPVFRTATCFRI